jgi:hypothetical protein
MITEGNFCKFVSRSRSRSQDSGLIEDNVSVQQRSSVLCLLGKYCFTESPAGRERNYKTIVRLR